MQTETCDVRETDANGRDVRPLTLEETLAAEGAVVHRIKGDSMMPLLDERSDLVRLVPLRGKPQVGDTVLFRSAAGKLTLHRVVKCRETYCMTRGDNRRSCETVPYERAVGLMDGYFKDGKFTPVTDAEYQKYVRRVLRPNPFRRRVIPAWKAEEEKRARDEAAQKEIAAYGRVRYTLRRIFPPFSKMKRAYPVLRRLPVLLPLFWLWRIFGVLAMRVVGAFSGKGKN